jgi:cardiolipin synthase
VTGALPGWIAIVVVSRDLMIISAIIVSRLMERPLAIKPMFVSKLNTAAQIVFAVLVLGTKAFTLDVPRLYATGVIIVAALTIISAAAYLARWMRHMANGADGG